MGHVCVVGVQFGDEGKGKVIDWLASYFDGVVRFQGGHNAGHTLVVGGETYKLSLLPSGVLWPGKKALLATGVILDPLALLKEMEAISTRGICLTPEDFFISRRATVLLPSHKRLDEWREGGACALGTTKRGIGPASEDRVGRRALLVEDLFLPRDELSQKLEIMLFHHNALFRGFGLPEVMVGSLLEGLGGVVEKLFPFLCDSEVLLRDWMAQGQKILFEGAQGLLLDIYHGTYPCVTSSSTYASSVSLGVGCPLGSSLYALGVIKAYITRVGEGLLPSACEESVAMRLAQEGHEIGTVTGRARRCGWFDVPLARRAIQQSGIQGLVLTKLDVFDSFEEIKLVVAYEGFEDVGLGSDLRDLRPVYEVFPGWKCSTYGLRDLDNYPKEARRYIQRLEDLLGVPIVLVSSSPRREDMARTKHRLEDFF